MARKIGLFSLALLTLGCGSTPTNYNNKAQANIHTPTIKKQTPTIANKFSLTINPSPNNARVRILNISPKYQDGIKLLKGKYHVEVSLSGFQTYKKWIEINNDKVLNLKLKKNIAPKLSGSGTVIWGKEDNLNKLVNRVVKIGKSYFTKVTEKTYTYDKAVKYCESLNDKNSKWRLPSKTDIQRANKKVDLNLAIEYTFAEPSFGTAAIFLKSNPNKKYKPVYDTRSRKFSENSSGHRVTCTTNKYGYFNIVSKVNDLRKTELKSIQTISPPNKPLKKKYTSIKPLKKGEFETSIEFDLRRNAHKEKAKKQIDIIDLNYQKSLTNWSKEIAKFKKDQNAKLKTLNTNKHSLSLIEKGLTEIYGNPQLLNIAYNADKEAFTIDIVSQQASFKPALFNLSQNSGVVNALVDDKKIKNKPFTVHEAIKLADGKTLLKMTHNYSKPQASFGHGYVGLLDNIIFKNKLFIQGLSSAVYVKPSIKPNQDFYIIVNEYSSSKYGLYIPRYSKYDKKKVNIDLSKISKLFKASEYLFHRNVNVPVKRKYAKRFKDILTKPNFVPTVEFEVIDGKLKFIAIEELKDPEYLVVEREYELASSNSNDMRNFLKAYPNSRLNTKAESKLAYLIKEETKEKKRLAKIATEKSIADAKIKSEKIEKNRLAKIAREKAEREFMKIGSCTVGSTIYHREKWNTTTSSGNIIADGLFGAATKEEFIIIYEGVVKGFVGEKVEVIINDYGVKQTVGGGFLQQKTWRKYDLAKHADKYLGKTQFYEKSRCN